MTFSNDVLLPLRSNASKATPIELQLAEYTAHKLQIDEYKLDIYAHLLQLDPKTRPNLQLIQQQPEINLRMRPVLLDFLMDVINKLSLSKSTFPLTVNIIDRYCSVRIVKKQHYQLLGLTALWIACKNLDSKFRVPSLNDLCKYCCHCYDKKLFLEMENHVLKSFGWLVDAPTFDSFIDVYIHSLSSSRFLAGSKSPQKTCNGIKVLAIYICELVQFYPNIYFNYTSPKIAYISVVIACLILDVCKTSNVQDLLSFIAVDTEAALLSEGEFDQAFSLLIKVLKCPPPSLKSKYFNEDSRFLSLMKLLVSFTWKHLAQPKSPSARPSVDTSPRQEPNCTPMQSGGSTTPKYPVTPVSQSISPKNTEYVPSLAYVPPPDFMKTLPSPNLSPGEQRNDYFTGPVKRGFGDVAPREHKRAKSVESKAYFFIH